MVYAILSLESVKATEMSVRGMGEQSLLVKNPLIEVYLAEGPTGSQKFLHTHWCVSYTRKHNLLLAFSSTSQYIHFKCCNIFLCKRYIMLRLPFLYEQATKNTFHSL